MGSYDDFIKAGLLSPQSRSDAGWSALAQLSSQLINRGAPRYSPTPPPMDLGAVMGAYNKSMQNDLQRGLAMHQFKRSEDEYARKEMERDAIANALKPQNVQTMDNDMAPMTVQQPSALMQTVPETYRPIVQAFANAGQGQQALGAILGAALKPRPRGSSLMQEAQLLFPNDLAKQKTFIEQSRNKAPVSINMKHAPQNIVSKVAATNFEKAGIAAAAAGAKLHQLGEMKNLLASGATTGTLAEQTMSIRKLLSDFGVVNDDLPIQEAIGSLGKELALAKHGPGMGPMTDNDFDIYQAIVPRLGNTAAGNRLIMRRLEREYRGQQMYAQVLQRQLLSAGGVKNFDPGQAWRQVAAALDNELGQLIPTFKTVEDFEKTGDRYVGQIVSVAGKGFEVKP